MAQPLQVNRKLHAGSEWRGIFLLALALAAVVALGPACLEPRAALAGPVEPEAALPGLEASERLDRSRPDRSLAPERDYQVTFKVGSGVETGIAQGGSITLPVSVSVSGAIGLAAATVLVQYDPADLRVTGCVRYAEAPASYCNAAYDPANGLIRFNLLADGGLLGDIALFEITFETAGSSTVNRLSQVTPLIESLADTQGEYMTSAAVGTPVRVLAPSGGGPAVYVGTPGGANPISITRGTTVTVPIVVQAVTGLGSASFALPFTSSVVRAVGCRAIQPPGSDVAGACGVHGDRVEASLLSMDGFSGAATVFELLFTNAATARPGQSSTLNLTVEAFADTAGARIPVRVVNNSLSISSASTAPAPRLRLEPQSQTLSGDARVTLHLFLDNGASVAAGSWNLRYDRNLLLAESCQFSPEAGATGACNATGQEGLVRMSMMNPSGVAPVGELASVTFRRNPMTLLNIQTTVAIDVKSFADLAGAPLAYQTQSATVQLAGDLGGPAAVSLAWGSLETYGLAIGSSLELPLLVTVDAARPVGSLTASLYYDPTVLRATRCVPSPGATANYSGYCNAHYDRVKGAVRFNLLGQEGVSGALAPFVLTVEPVSGAPVGRNSLLQFRMEAVTGPLGEPRTWSAVQPGVTILEPVPAALVKVGEPGGAGPEEAGQYVLAPGGKVLVPVSIVNVTDLGAATIVVKYDPTVARAIGCRVRTDLIGAGGGFCSVVPVASGVGTVRTALMIPDGFDGAGRFFEMTFADAPNAQTGMATALTVQVDNFVSTAGIPIPTTTGNGSIQIPCQLPPPVLSIALAPQDDVSLSWPHITRDVCGLPVTVTEYQVWRDREPYNLTSTAPYALVTTPAGANESTTISALDATTRAVPGGFFYRVVAVAPLRANSAFSNLKAKFTFIVVPGGQ